MSSVGSLLIELVEIASQRYRESEISLISQLRKVIDDRKQKNSPNIRRLAFHVLCCMISVSRFA